VTWSMNHEGHEGTRRRSLESPINMLAPCDRIKIKLHSTSQGAIGMFCARCGQGMPEGATLCAACGQQTSPANPPLGGLPSPSSNMPGSVVPQKISGMAIASLIFGIFFIFFPLSIPAIVFGHIALSQVKRSAGRLGGRGLAIAGLGGRGLAIAGLVMGYLGIAVIPLILIIAAIAIPNLLRARIAANEALAATTVRSINTAQGTYQATYPAIGYARDLASLGGAEPCTPVKRWPA
jgi:Domain of unknown function (DUF4190)